jgi:UDPglucose 6-dehydrogenase
MIAQNHGQTLKLLKAVEEVNQFQKNILVKKITQKFGNDLTGKKFAIWGLAFKPNTDDMREAPSRVIIQNLILRGASVRVYDPIAMHEAKKSFETDLKDYPSFINQIEFVDNYMDAANEADAVVIVTEWKEFRSPDFGTLKKNLKSPLIFDGRNLYDPEVMGEWGIEYFGIGRKAASNHVDLNKLYNLQQMNAISHTATDVNLAIRV